MIVSILTRKTRAQERPDWQSRLEGVLPRIREVLEGHQGFAGVTYLWGADTSGETAQITRWETLEDCLRYVREGGAAMVATIEDAAVPTAAYPDGAWVRTTFEIAVEQGDA